MMNRSIGSCVLCLGAAAALALAGCSKNEPPAKQATSSPTFESNVGSSPTYESGQPSPQSPPGAGSNEPYGAGQRVSEQPGQGEQGMSSERPSAQPAPTASERDLCGALMHDVTLRVEDGPGGAVIEIKPRASADLPLLQRRAHEVEQRLGQSAGAAPSGATCELFAIVRGGATTAVSETPEAVRILITTTDPSRVRALRKQVRDFANASEKSYGKPGSQH
jgi:hypothetical protein